MAPGLGGEDGRRAGDGRPLGAGGGVQGPGGGRWGPRPSSTTSLVGCPII